MARPAQHPVETAPVGQTPAAEFVDELPETSDTGMTGSVGSPRTRARGPSASFEESAAQEYAYVASDIRRIAVVGGSLFAVLIALWLLIEVLGIVKI